jgi:phytol kinase
LNWANLNHFFLEAWPTAAEFKSFGVPILAVTLLQVGLTVLCRQKFGFPVAVTRKIFHILVFCSAAIIQMNFSLAVLCMYGFAISVAVWHALWRGDGQALYECLARPSDAPQRTRFIIQPWLATLLGGVLAQTFFGSCAVAGFWVVGCADASAEPVGYYWGKHPATFKFFFWIKDSKRTWEGSLSVGLVSLVIFMGLGLVAWPYGLAGALLMMTIEALSPHGLDNFCLQLGASGYLYLAVQT